MTIFGQIIGFFFNQGTEDTGKTILKNVINDIFSHLQTVKEICYENWMTEYKFFVKKIIILIYGQILLLCNDPVQYVWLSSNVYYH